MNAKERTLIGKSSSLLSREAVWRVRDGIEMQSREGYQVVRRRVLFEDILFVTHHRTYGAVYLIVNGAIALFFIAIGFLIVGTAGTDAWPVGLVFALIGLPSLIALMLRLMFRLDIITVYGKRTKAAIRFRLRKKRAREVYAQITSAVRQAQEKMRREIADSEPPPPALDASVPMPEERLDDETR